MEVRAFFPRELWMQILRYVFDQVNRYELAKDILLATVCTAWRDLVYASIRKLEDHYFGFRRVSFGNSSDWRALL